MKGLMYFCANWGALECQLKDLARKWHRMIKNNLDKFSWPYWDKIEKYDKCCRSCLKCLIFATEITCIICKNVKLEVLYNPSKKSGSIHRYYYICPKCNTSYYSYEKLN
jgi:hypothetical protein